MSSEEAKPTAIIVDSPAAGVVASNATGANNAEPTTKPSSASTASAVASLPTSFTVPSPIDLTQDDDEAFEENHEEESFQMMVPISNHPLQLSVVGIRYYRGVAHPGEYVQLVREPHNPFDRNAVRVDNLHGQKVGHIKKEQAAMLAPIMDHLSDSVKLDGTIPYAGNQFTQPCDCEVLTRVNAGEDPAEAIERVVEQMNRYSASRQLVQRLRPKSSKKSATAPLATAAAPAVQRKNVDWRTQQKDLDDMFDKQTKEQLENLPDLEMPSQLTNVTLFDYQVQGIKWLVHNETSTSLAPFYKQVRESGQIKWLCEITNCSQTHEPKRIRGGILADEMGLGKSLQTIGLILCNPPEGHVYPNGNSVPLRGASEEDAMSNDDKEEDKKPAAAPTVTVLRKFPVKTLQLVLSKAGLVATGKKAELVLSCQQGLASGTLTGDNFTSEVIDELANFVPPVFGGGSLAGPTPTANVATLIVCPVSVMSNWVHQIESHVKPGVLRVALYHGPDRHLLIPRIRNNEIDVLIVSYSTLAAEVPSDKKSGKENVQPPAAKKRKNKNGSILEETFYRVVLDEAQQIRTSKTRAFNAVASVKADRRLCLTGTPFVNKVDDINSLLSFLGVEPLNDSNVFRRAITQPIQNGEEMGLTRLRTTMACIALRRSKALANLKITAKTVSLLSVEFPEGFHKRVHDCLFATARAIFEAHLHEGEDEALKNYTSIFETLLRIRQCCCSARLVPKARRDSAEQVLRELQNRGGKPLTCEEGKALMEKLRGAFESEEAARVPECSICLEEMDEDAAIILRSCLHIFCASCIGKVNVDYNAKCPLCRHSFQKTDMIKKSAASAAATAENGDPASMSVEDDDIGISPKVAALLEAIKEMKPDEKGVIFSQFTSFLDIVGHAMQAAGHSFTRIDGSKRAGDRIKAISDFNTDDDGPRFILCSLHAAGTGINLTRGSWAFMLDTWWNESVENQAMDRIHRLGQKRDVRVCRLVMKDSIEERIITLQEAKAALGKGTMQKLKPDEKRKARITALKDLFLIGKTEQTDEA